MVLFFLNFLPRKGGASKHWRVKREGRGGLAPKN
jgi:hypothetical protein